MKGFVPPTKTVGIFFRVATSTSSSGVQYDSSTGAGGYNRARCGTRRGDAEVRPNTQSGTALKTCVACAQRLAPSGLRLHASLYRPGVDTERIARHFNLRTRCTCFPKRR
jgi:hypothetical protein